jgi:hypothetical protein
MLVYGSSRHRQLCCRGDFARVFRTSNAAAVHVRILVLLLHLPLLGARELRDRDVCACYSCCLCLPLCLSPGHGLIMHGL